MIQPVVVLELQRLRKLRIGRIGGWLDDIYGFKKDSIDEGNETISLAVLGLINCSTER